MCPGVPLIGPKIAGQLLNDFQTLEGVFDNIDNISGKKRKENLTNFQESGVPEPQPCEVSALTCRLKSTGRRVELAGSTPKGLPSCATSLGFVVSPTAAAALSGDAPPATEWKANYVQIDTPEKLAELIAQLEKQPRISIDTETTSANPRFAELVGYSFAWEAGTAYYVPVRAPAGEPTLDPDETAAALKGVLENPNVEKLGQNLKYEQVVLRGTGIELAGVTFDTMVADYLLKAGARNHSLDNLASRYLNHTTLKIKDLIGTAEKSKTNGRGWPLELVTPYAAEDADVPVRLAPLLAERLQQDGLTRLFHDVEVPLIDALAECEFNGIRLDVDLLKQMSDDYGDRLERLEAEIHDIGGREFNINSPKQLGEVLFDDLGLPVIKKTKTGRSTDMDVLEQLARRTDLPGHELAGKDCRLPPFFKTQRNVHRRLAGTGSSGNRSRAYFVEPSRRRDGAFKFERSEPAKHSYAAPAEGREIRSAFIPGEDDWVLLAADYSQVELRVLAHFCGDDALSAAFANDEDIHARVASEVHGVPLEAVDADMRRSAKAVNFGIIYGQTPFGLAKALDIEQEEAAAFIEAYFARYPSVAQFMDEVLDVCMAQGFVTTLLGRRRRIDGGAFT